jgi:hypothetical protein
LNTKKLSIAIILAFLAFTNPSFDDHIRAFSFENRLKYSEEGIFHVGYWSGRSYLTDTRRMRRINFFLFSIGQVDYPSEDKRLYRTFGVAGFVILI